jgi:alpha-glucosidase
VPTTWDETKAIHGKVGDYITVARKSGNDWYIGSMTDWDSRSLEISLDFLDKGKYQATIYQDAPLADDYPDRLIKTTISVTAKDQILAKMSSGGGHVVHLTPNK